MLKPNLKLAQHFPMSARSHEPSGRSPRRGKHQSLQLRKRQISIMESRSALDPFVDQAPETSTDPLCKRIHSQTSK